MGKRGRGEEERGREEGSYFTRGRVTCLFRVVEQIYIALSPPVIPLSRCCCRTLDSARRREIKGTAGRGGGGGGRGGGGGGNERKGKTRGKKRKMEGRKTRNISYLEISAPAARRNVPHVMYALPANAAFISPRSCICRRLSALRRRGRALRTVYFRFRVAYELLPPPS